MFQLIDSLLNFYGSQIMSHFNQKWKNGGYRLCLFQRQGMWKTTLILKSGTCNSAWSTGLYNSKYQRWLIKRQIMLVTFHRSGFVTIILPNVVNVFTKLRPSRGIWNCWQITEKLHVKRMEFSGAFGKIFKENNRDHWHPRSLNPGKAIYSMPFIT